MDKIARRNHTVPSDSIEIALMPAPDALPVSAALLIIDLQKAIDAPYWGPRNNPDCERKVAALLERWRATRRPVYHIRHDSTEPQSAYRPGQPGNTFKDEVRPRAGEPVIAKRVNSAFIGTSLGPLLKGAGTARSWSRACSPTIPSRPPCAWAGTSASRSMS